VYGEGKSKGGGCSCTGGGGGGDVVRGWVRSALLACDHGC
jgi:hypothetical protein